jgi:hypothetical protein
VAVIFAGYLQASRGVEKPRSRGVEKRGAERQVLVGNTQNLYPKSQSPAIAFIEARLAALSDDEMSRECGVWSVPAREIDVFSRAEARRVWSFRNRLTTVGQAALDARPPGIRLQLAELYFDVMSADITTMELAPVAPVERASSGND